MLTVTVDAVCSRYPRIGLFGDTDHFGQKQREDGKKEKAGQVFTSDGHGGGHRLPQAQPRIETEDHQGYRRHAADDGQPEELRVLVESEPAELVAVKRLISTANGSKTARFRQRSNSQPLTPFSFVFVASNVVLSCFTPIFPSFP